MPGSIKINTLIGNDSHIYIRIQRREREYIIVVYKPCAMREGLDRWVLAGAFQSAKSAEDMPDQAGFLP